MFAVCDVFGTLINLHLITSSSSLDIKFMQDLSIALKKSILDIMGYILSVNFTSKSLVEFVFVMRLIPRLRVRLNI